MEELDMILEAQLASLEAQIGSIRMILALKRAASRHAEEPAEPLVEVPSDPEGFVMPPTFRNARPSED